MMDFTKRRFGSIALLMFCLIYIMSVAAFPAQALASDVTEDWENEFDGVYTVYGPDNGVLFVKASHVFEGDQYISADNKAYEIVSVDDSTLTARAVLIGDEEMPDVGDIWDERDVSGENALELSGEAEAAAKKLVGLYCTHSDESYVPTDGISNTEKTKGGIYDVANSLKDELEKKGVSVMLDESTHFPHDAGAYRRSRQTAINLLESGPTALFDVHRDALPAEEYEKTIDGKEVSRVRLLVGRSNQNMAANKDFAKLIKAVADKKYPGMIKDIFIGKGNYNQELTPRSVLLEFGTHEIEKERVIESTKLMADVINKALFGSATSANAGGANTGRTGSTNAKNSTAAASNGGAASGILWVLALGGIGALVYAFIATGGKEMGHKLRRGASEITGGLIPPADAERDKHSDGNE